VSVGPSGKLRRHAGAAAPSGLGIRDVPLLHNGPRSAGLRRPRAADERTTGLASGAVECQGNRRPGAGGGQPASERADRLGSGRFPSFPVEARAGVRSHTGRRITVGRSFFRRVAGGCAVSDLGGAWSWPSKPMRDESAGSMPSVQSQLSPLW